MKFCILHKNIIARSYFVHVHACVYIDGQHCIFHGKTAPANNNSSPLCLYLHCTVCVTACICCMYDCIILKLYIVMHNSIYVYYMNAAIDNFCVYEMHNFSVGYINSLVPRPILYQIWVYGTVVRIYH